MNTSAGLGPFEAAVLAAIMRLRQDAYGVTIRGAVDATTGRSCAIGAIYTTLERLEVKGFVTSEMGEPTPERGGRSKRYYEITGTGQMALSEYQQAQSRMFNGLPALS